LKLPLRVLVAIFFLASNLSARDLYWVGGTGNWNEESHWSVSQNGEGGAGLPSTDDQLFVPAEGATIEISEEVFCRSLTFGDQSKYEYPNQTVSVLKGTGAIHIADQLYIGCNLRDQFTGTWIFTDMYSKQRAVTIAGITNPNHIFAGKLIFKKNPNDTEDNNWQLGGDLLVANSVEIQNGVSLMAFGTDIILVNQFIGDSEKRLSVLSIAKPDSEEPSTARINTNQSPQSHTVTTIVIPNLCNGQCTASATAVVTGGSGNFSYQWSTVPVQTTATAINLCAGTYLVVVTDNINGDQIPAFAIVTDPPPLVIFFSNTPALCNTQCNGSSTATAAGGTPGYTYLWSPGNQITPAISGQCAGTYSLTITDINGCQITQPSIITQPPALNPQGVRTNVNCNGGCTGTASVNPVGGTGPYTYNWTPGNIASQSITGLCVGIYVCTVTDANGCTAAYVANITQPTPLQVSISHTNVSCFGACNGTANSTVTGGTGPFNYLWAPGGQTTPNLTGLCAGSYTLTVTDNNSCVATQTVTITQPPQLVVLPTGINITCFGACNGIAAANASGGTPNYTYSWAPVGGTGSTATGLCPGNYTVTVTDANGCTTTGNVTITQPNQLLANTTDVDVNCFGSCTGSATSNPLGGTGPYTYNWLPGNLNTQTITNLCPGSYTLTVTDANGCTANSTVTITQPPTLQTNVTITQVTCNGACNGTATSNPSGGVGPYTYNWAPGGQTTSGVTGLCPGTYTLTVTDANGCTNTRTVVITQPNTLTVSINTSPITCSNSCNGTAAAVVGGGTPTYTYLWSPGNQTGASIGSLCAGNYTVQVTDNNGCVATASVALTQPNALVLNASSTNVTCNGSCDGSASIAASGGTPGYTYSWAPGGQTTPSITGLCSGTYTVTVTDAAGCTDTRTITITQPPAILANVTHNDVSCNGGCNGTATANATGGTGPYTYLWSPNGQTTNGITGLCAGNYTITITDANGCIVNQQVNITQPPPLLATVASTTSSCGICNGTASVAVSGGTSPYAYFWTPSNQTNPTATGLCVGQYTVTVTDAAGCTATAVAIVNPVVNITVTSSGNTLSCFGACDGVASANANGGTTPYTYVWMPGNQVSQTVTGLCAGSYTVTATDANGCFNSSVVTFVDPPILVLSANAANASCNGVCDGTGTANASGGTGTISYLWMPGGQTTATATGLCAGSYTVTATDVNGCTATQTISITEPTLITTNGSATAANCTLCDGSITVNPSGGTGPYTYLWAPGGQTTATITNLCPGIYTVTITDNTGCSINEQIAVGNITGPTVVPSFTNVSCNGVCDGTASVVASGAGPFGYDWTPGAPLGDGTPAITALCDGIYFCQVTDNAGCINFISVTITEPLPITANSSIVNVSCNGLSDGSITANPTGGTGTYTYNWLPGNLNTQTITGLVAGTYTLTITDVNNCSVIEQITVTQPLPLTIATSFTDVLCNGACNGTGTATVSGGTGPYTYNWSSGQGTPTATNLCPGTYTIDVVDANGCTSQQQISITEPTPLVTSATATDVTCNGICDGTATVTANGGVGSYTYTWSPGGGTTPTATGLCPGAYSVITLDANGCSSVNSVIILQPSAIVLAASSGPLSCFGSCNGVASVSATGGSPGYNYSWSPSGQTTATATSLCAGVYTVTVTDASGCTQTAFTSVTEPNPLQANVSSTTTSCSGGCDGTAAANPIGGTGPYSYLWAPGAQVSSSINNLCAGTYTVTVRDMNGCTDVQTIIVNPPPPITLTVASASASCGNCDGTFNVSPSGGIGPYTYAWSGGLPAQPNQSNLCAGVYTVIVTDATGCSDTFSLALNNSGGPTGETVTVTSATCPSSCDGTATVIPIGGTSPYTYLWIPGGQTTNSLTGMCAGSYFLQITDANGCIRFSPVTITGPAPINANPFVTNTTCTGFCDGAISLTPVGGTGAYTYSWLPGGQTTAAITSLCSGTYTCTITDANGCTVSSISTVNPWNTLTAAISSVNPTCANNCDGSATVNIITGTAPFVYLWTDPIAQTDSIASGLCSGTYTVTVTDVGGCSAVLPVTLTGPTPIQITPTVNPSTCGQCDGSASLAVIGGTSPYTFAWTTGGTTAAISGLCAGVYGVTVTDATGCSAVLNVNVSSSNAPAISNPTQTDVSCNGSCDGSISISATGGVLPYDFLWLPGGQTSPAITNLCAGTYTVQVRDSAGCTITQSFTITEPSAILSNQSITNTACGICAGAIVLNTSGGTGPYTYLWAPGAQTSSSISNLCAGIYTVTITDANGCSNTIPIPVSNSNSGISITVSDTAAACNGSCNGSALVIATGGVSPYTYAWSNGGNNDTLTGLCAGNYIVQVIDAAGCINSASVLIDEPSPLFGSFPFVQNELCTGACNGQITAIANGGTLPYSYNWSNAQTTVTATNLCSGTYTVTVTDANGCSFAQTDTIVSPVVLILGIPVTADASCNNTPDGSISVPVTGGATPYAYVWTGPNSFTSNASSLTNIFYGTYTVVITDANGCTASDTITINALTVTIAAAGNDTTFCQQAQFTLDGSASQNASSYQWIQLPSMTVLGTTDSVNIILPAGSTSYVLIVTNGTCTDSDTITITSLPPIGVSAGPDIEIVTGSSTVIGGSPTGPSNSTYVWNPSNNLNDAGSSNPTASPTVTTTYVVYVTDPNGCTGSDTMEVIVVPAIDFPNGFTPNNDGINDVWVIDNIQLFPNNRVEVYNRWGEMLFASDGYNVPWDGRYEGKDLPVGTYYYIINLNDPLFPEAYTGPITIIR
jgi:gliding motility-associated-like protein